MLSPSFIHFYFVNKSSSLVEMFKKNLNFILIRSDISPMYYANVNVDIYITTKGFKIMTNCHRQLTGLGRDSTYDML